MKKQIFRFILCACFILAVVPSVVWAIENGNFEAGETGWTKYMNCPSTSPPGVSIQLNNTNGLFPPLGDSEKLAVYFVQVGGSCKEMDAYLLQRITVPNNATLKFWYRIEQPIDTQGLATATFRVKLKDLNGAWVDEKFVEIFQESVSNPCYELEDRIIKEWTMIEKILPSSYAGNTYDILFQFGTTEQNNNYQIFFMLDNISFQTGPSDPVPGDIYNNDGVNLTDAIISLQITAGIAPSGAINLNNDVDGNGTIGLENPIYILQDVADLRP
ncbi:MAG: hypothetical protein AB7S75_17175 [Desulfococcaceae bacterium]